MNRKKQNLPDFIEWLSILTLTSRHRWSALEKQMMAVALRRHRAGTLYALVVVLLSILLPFFGYQYIRATLLVDEYRTGVNLDSRQLVRIIDEMKSCRLLIDPILESKLADAQSEGDKNSILRYKVALSPSHPDKLNGLYSEIFPQKRSWAYGTNYIYSSEQILAIRILYKYDSTFAQRMWEIVSDRRGDISHRYFAASVLWELNPSDPRWAEIASYMITDHDFSRDTYLSFNAVRRPDLFGNVDRPRMDTGLKERFKQALLKKIKECRESSCPVSLIGDLLTPEEALTLIGDGYLGGQFSLESLTEQGNLMLIQRIWYQQHGEMKDLDLRVLFGRESSNRDKERRRQLALLLLKDKPWLTGNRTLPGK
jgi:hypothetical protein